MTLLRRKSPGLLLILLILLPFGKAIAQGPYKDYQTWFWLQAEKEFTKHLSLSVQYQLRIDNTGGAFKWSYFYLDGIYDINKHFNFQAVYQFCTSHQFDLHSFYAGITGKYDIGRFKFSARTAFQNEIVHFTPTFSEEKGNETKYEWRNRFSIRYKLFSNITPFIFAEPYTRFAYHEPYVDKMRNGIGFDYAMNPYNSFTIYYLYQPEYDIKKYTIQNVLGIVYSITLPRHKIHWHKFFNPKKTKLIEDEPEKDNNVLDRS